MPRSSDLTFSPVNWNAPQTVRLAASLDPDAVNGSAVFTLASAGLTNVPVTAVEIDKDVQFIIVSTNLVSVPEGGSNTFTVRLNTQPTNNVPLTTTFAPGDTDPPAAPGAR